jgi:hypothetical protein
MVSQSNGHSVTLSGLLIFQQSLLLLDPPRPRCCPGG